MSRCKNEHMACENGGSCWDKPDGTSECICFGGYTGSRCQYAPAQPDTGNRRNMHILRSWPN